MPYQTTVLGIDASARSTGLVLFEQSKPTIEHVIKPGNRKEGARLKYIEEALNSVIRNKDIALATMEGPSYRSTNKPFTLGEVYGTFKLILCKLEVPLVIVPPRALKKYAVGKGTAKKELMISAAMSQGCGTEQEDIADAWHLACLALDLLKGNSSLSTRASEEVVQSLKGKICL